MFAQRDACPDCGCDLNDFHGNSRCGMVKCEHPEGWEPLTRHVESQLRRIVEGRP